MEYAGVAEHVSLRDISRDVTLTPSQLQPVVVVVVSKVNFGAALAGLLQFSAAVTWFGLNGMLLLYQSRLYSMMLMTSSQSGYTSSAHVSHRGCTM